MSPPNGRKPKLLDLFCGAGGAAVGYHRAGFDVTGVDLKPQPRFPYPFIQADAIEYLMEHGKEFDAIHASPPCQQYSITRSIHQFTKEYPDLVALTRSVLNHIGKPYIIENVVGAPMISYVILCGTMFGLRVYRHRLFECTFMVLTPEHKKHTQRCSQIGSKAKPDEMVTVAGHFVKSDGVAAMEIDWMTTAELAQAIPPAYTQYIGSFLQRVLR